jgi:hypothetical protein
MAGMHARVRRWPYARMGSALVLGAVLAGCTDDGSPVAADEPGRAPRPEGDAERTSVSPVVPRVDVRFEVNGAFRPGVPVNVTAVAWARRQADDMRMELVVHDEPSPAGTPAEAAGRRPVGSTQGGLGRGSERRLSQNITFAEPGYYRVSARVVSSGPTPDVMPGDSLILNTTHETLYILVDENGGRLTAGFDRAALGARTPLYGSYGPFVPGGRAAGGARSLLPVGGPSRQTSTTYTYYVEYDNQDTGTRRPVPGAQAEIKCLNTSYAVHSTLYPTVNADGSFTFTCPYGYFDGTVRLRDWYSDVLRESRQPAGVDYFWEGTARRLVASSNYAAHVFVTLRQYVPTAESRFGGRWRSRLPVVVSDTVRTNYSRIFGEDGRFVTMHEYGHAYQWGAIEQWNNYGSCPSPHYTTQFSNRGCAYVEGFATFFAVWMAGNELGSAAYETDYHIETQTFYTSADGMGIEGSVAGFFYDLVDGSGQRDNSANTGVYEESWDTAVYPGSFIGDMMATCAPYYVSSGTNVYTYYLDGLDQLVYCMEGNVSAEGYTSLWRTTWSGVTHSATLPSGYSTTLVRTLWRRNLYGTS